MSAIGNRSRKITQGAYLAALKTDRAKFGALLGFLALVFLMGGGSRGDILSVPLLRPICIFFAAYAVAVAGPGQIRAIGAPIYLFSALAVLLLFQLVPLPPQLWTSLPGRELYAAALAEAGLGNEWRPLTLSPARTFNSLSSLSAPLAALLLFGVQGDGFRRRALLAVIGAGMLSALWGLLQLTGSPNGPLYLYRITNAGLPVGLFANRNHQAVFLAALVPFVAHFGLTPEARERGGPVFAVGVTLLLLATAIMTGSRAGLIAAVMALATAAVIMRLHQSQALGTGRRGFRVAPWSAVAAGLVLVGLFIGAMFWYGEALALERLFATDRVMEKRAELFPILGHMVAVFFPVGAGFGAFDLVYDQFEPARLLSDTYLNQAHNDWLQILIEGGLPAALLLVIFLTWLLRQALTVARDFRARSPATTSRRLADLSFVAIIGMASVVDYPLRVPSLMVVFALVLADLSRAKRHARPPMSGHSD